MYQFFINVLKEQKKKQLLNKIKNKISQKKLNKEEIAILEELVMNKMVCKIIIKNDVFYKKN